MAKNVNLKDRTVLVVGGGGREHALVRELSKKFGKVYCAPGNAGISRQAEIVENPCTTQADIAKLVQFASDEGIDLTIVGPEAPLMLGIANQFQDERLTIYGHRKDTAHVIEGSKVLCCKLLQRAGVPIPSSQFFTVPEKAKNFIRTRQEKSSVIKADGLCGGKGVFVCREKIDAIRAVDTTMVDRQFGDAGKSIVIQDRAEGYECSVTAITEYDPVTGRCYYRILPSSQDYKQAYNGNRGLMTGGMGAFSPLTKFDLEWSNLVRKHIVEKTIRRLLKEGYVPNGVLYFGLMVTDKGPVVLEINCRFGDPEAQVVLPRVTNFANLMWAATHGRLKHTQVRVDPRRALCVVAVAGEYPEGKSIDAPITGLEKLEQSQDDGAYVLHAGTKFCTNGGYLTNGGRILVPVCMDGSIENARRGVYEMLERKDFVFPGMRYRTDIAKEV